MSETVTAAPAVKVPWWFWLVAVLAVVWNCYGAFDFLMSVTKGDEWYRSMGMTEAQIARMHAYPAWMYAVWFAGTWGGLIGAILLLLRRRWAFHAFVISLAGFVVSLVYEYLLSGGGDAAMIPIQATIFVICAVLIWFAHFATTKGFLR